MAVAGSLFDAPHSSTLGAASEWLTGTLLGDAAIGLSVIAVAFVGLMLMAGRLAIRDGLRVAMGCFVLLGAPVIAAGLRDAALGTVPTGSVVEPPIAATPPPPPLPASTYDPYAGASLRRD